MINDYNNIIYMYSIYIFIVYLSIYLYLYLYLSISVSISKYLSPVFDLAWAVISTNCRVTSSPVSILLGKRAAPSGIEIKDV